LYAEDRLIRSTSAASATVSMSGSSLSSTGAIGARRPARSTTFIRSATSILPRSPSSKAQEPSAVAATAEPGWAGPVAVEASPAAGTVDAVAGADHAAAPRDRWTRPLTGASRDGRRSRALRKALDLADQADLTNPLQRNSSHTHG